MRKLTLVTFTLIAVFMSFSAYAHTWYVDGTDGNDANSGDSWDNAKSTIQAGIDAAFDGDTVLVADGTYTGDGNRDIDFGGKEITLQADSFTIDTSVSSPTNLTLSFTPEKDKGVVNLSWEAPEDEDLTSYNVYCSTLSFEEISNLEPIATNVEKTEYQDFLQKSSDYYYAVTAIDEPGNESEISNICHIDYKSPKVFLSLEEKAYVGDVFTIKLKVENMFDLYGFQFDLVFDPDLLEVKQVSEGTFLNQDGVDTFWKEPEIDNQKGAVRNAYAIRQQQSGVEGNGVLANISFKAISPETSILRLENVKFTNPNAESISIVKVENSFRLTIYVVEVEIPDPNQEAVIRNKLNKPEGPITDTDLQSITSLYGAGEHIANITGLEHCINLTELNLRGNQITDISPLANLTKLTELHLWGNQIVDISPLSNLTNLTFLRLGRNQISDISPLSELTNLQYLNLGHNQISDIQPLVDNSGIDEDDEIDLDENPLNVESLKTLVPELKAREVKVIGVSIIVPDIEAPHALSLDGNGDFVKIPHSESLSISNTITIESWFLRHSHDDTELIVGNGGGWDDQGYHIMSMPDGRIRFELQSATTKTILDSDVISDGKWHHIVATYDGNMMIIYINGNLNQSVPHENGMGSQDVDIGIGLGLYPSYGGSYFCGIIDEVRIWKVARTQEEIRATMNTMLQGNELGLVGYWNFDDGTARDLTAYGNHGTLHGDAGIMPIVDAWPPPQIGDTSGDGSISAYDASLILQYCVGLIDQLPANISSIGEKYNAS